MKSLTALAFVAITLMLAGNSCMVYKLWKSKQDEKKEMISIDFGGHKLQCWKS